MSRDVRFACPMIPMRAIKQRPVPALLGVLIGLTLAGSSHPGESGEWKAGTYSQEQQRVLLRMARDSLVVGHYRFSVKERQQVAFDIPPGDPRAALLQSATKPKETATDVAATIVSTPAEAEAERRYIAYWLGYRIMGDDVRGLSPVEWDSIFQVAGRRAIVRFSPRGQGKGVEVGSDAVRPVGQALARALSGLATELPVDSVSPGSRWEGKVAVTVDAPDGSRLIATMQVSYRLRELRRESEGVVARIEFDGEPVPSSGDAPQIGGRYYGESYFSVTAGRYDKIMALADIELEWNDASGLPPSRLMVRWQGDAVRR
jgi:hypothetical protein